MFCKLQDSSVCEVTGRMSSILDGERNVFRSVPRPDGPPILSPLDEYRD